MIAFAAALFLQAAPPFPSDNPVVREYWEVQRPLYEAQAYLTYVIGACEPHYSPADVDFYVREYVALEPADNPVDQIGQRLVREGYSNGRDDRDSLGFDQTQCERVTRSAVEGLREAESGWKPSLAAFLAKYPAQGAGTTP